MDVNKDIFKIESNHGIPRKGRILIAEPFLSGSYFNRSVVLLVDCSSKGAMGFILNKKIEVPLNAIIDNFPHFEANISIGGPVNTDFLYFIHSLGEDLPGSMLIKDGLYWGGDYEELKRRISLGMIENKQVRFFLGYSGWDAGQLEEELNDDSWIVSDIDHKAVMNCRSQATMWVKRVKAVGGKYALWEHFPKNPSFN